MLLNALFGVENTNEKQLSLYPNYKYHTANIISQATNKSIFNGMQYQQFTNQ